MVAHALTLFIKENHSFVFYSHISSVKYNKTLKALLLHLYEIYSTALGEGLVTNIALGFTSYYTDLPLDSHLKLYISYKLAAVL